METKASHYQNLHFVFWVLYILVQSLVYMNFYEFETIKVVRETGEEMVERTTFPATFLISMWVQLLELPGKLLAVYLHLWILLERYLFRQRFGQYFLGLLLVLVFANFMQSFLLLFLPAPRFMHDTQLPHFLSASRSLQYIFTCIAVMAVTGALELLRYFYQEQNKRQEIEKQHIATELQLLKAQIHPHFFFNTLNSLYGLALEKSEHTPASILRLSELMNFVLYESKAKDVPLLREMEIIEDYIALEKLRYGERVQVAIHKSGTLAEWRIPALLLLPFVENAFKHGVSPETQQAWMNITLQAEKESLKWVVENSNSSSQRPQKAEGLGLENVRRRLQLLYPEQHRLEIWEEEDTFMVVLELKA